MLGYLTLRVFIELFRIIPFRLLYILSDILRFVFFFVIKYRKRTALDNLRKAFPEITEKEIRKIAWKSYQNLTDIMLESFKGMFVNEKNMRKRMKVINREICDVYAEQGKSTIYLTGHCANWEWAIIIDKYLKHKIVSVFKPLKNELLNSYMKKNRERFGMELVSMQNTRKAFETNSPIGIVLIADQSPGTLHDAIWVDFFNRDTPCIHGPEAYAKRFNLPLIFAEFDRVKRGYYNLEFFHLIDEPIKYKKGEITQLYMKRLEEYIRRKPEYWVWTHKRWKHKRDENGEILRDYYYKK